MLLERLGARWAHLAAVVVSTVLVYAVVILLSRLGGVRSLAKLHHVRLRGHRRGRLDAGVDPAGQHPAGRGAVGLALLFGLQWVVATLRRRGYLRGLVDNSAIVLVVDGQPVEANLRHARVARAGARWRGATEGRHAPRPGAGRRHGDDG